MNHERVYCHALAIPALTLVILLGLQVGSAFAQLTITGRVTDERGTPLPGAEVFVEEIQIGTVADSEARYQLVIPESRLTGGEATLTARHLGYRSESDGIELVAGEDSENFSLALDPLEVEAIVAIGQGLQQRRETLGATVNSVSAQDLTATQEGNVVAALAGKAPNVEVTSSSGEPGAGAYIRIRGANTLEGSTQPLFIIDGVPLDNSSVGIESSVAGTVEQNRAGDLNPEDIESIEILKGAAAAAIYGSRAANGVVIITTKSGTKGDTRITYKLSATRDEVTELVPLQRQFGQGLTNAVFGEEGVGSSTVSYGAPLSPGTPVFDHADELYDTGNTWDHDLQLSGGSERTTYFLSLGRTEQDGVFKGNSAYNKTTVRLKGSHDFRDDLTVGGNFSYADAEGDLIQKGSNISGVQLGALRTPPEFNNLPYLDEETGLHRSYRLPEPTSVLQPRGYDNPFWVLNEIPNTTDVGRVFGNVEATYEPLSWLNVDYTLGSDYWNDERLTLFPKSSSSAAGPVGTIIRANLVNWIVDSNLLLTLSKGLTADISGSLTLGQNLNHAEFRRFQVDGFNQILGTDQLDFAVDKDPDEYREEIRTEGYFAQGNVEFFNQYYLNAGIRGDRSSTFGREERFYYPNASAVWEFTANEAMLEQQWIDFGRVRLAYGQVGKQPPVFSNVNAFTKGFFTDGWLFPNGLNSIYAGFDGVFSEGVLGNQDIEPERTSEFEVGLDLAFLDNRIGFNVVRYDRKTEDAILELPVAPSTGFFSRFQNGAEWENEGWEVQLNLRPLQTETFGWDIDAQWARNESCVTELLGAESFALNGFTGSLVAVVQPEDINGDGEPDEEGCHPFGVLYGQDFVRFGRDLVVDGVNIDEAFPNAAPGTLYIAEDGFPLNDPKNRVVGDPNPDWTASIRNTVTLFNKLRISGLIDISQGNEMWNGTKGALVFFGTHESTLPFQGAGTPHVFEGEGPGAGQEVIRNWATWTVGGLGSGFTGPFVQFIEDASFVKLRDVSVSYSFDQPFIQQLGFSTLDLKLSGRNLATWTDYTGIDPESNLTDQSTGRGLDYFNNPQVRSFVVTLQFNR